MSSVLWVAHEVGSVELIPDFVKAGVDARKAKLDSADFAFTGNGPDGPAEFGVERKTLTDYADSAKTGRLYGVSTETHESQMDRMLNTYDFAWLLLEGDYRTNVRGRFEQLRGRKGYTPVPGHLTEDVLNKELLSLDLRGGLRTWRSTDRLQTVRWVTSLFRSHTDKKWDDHTTLRRLQRRESIKPVSTFRDMVMRLEGIGFAQSKAVENFVAHRTDEPEHSLRTMLRLLGEMTIADWENLDVPERGGTSKKFGTPRALKVVDILRRER